MRGNCSDAQLDICNISPTSLLASSSSYLELEELKCVKRRLEDARLAHLRPLSAKRCVLLRCTAPLKTRDRPVRD